MQNVLLIIFTILLSGCTTNYSLTYQMDTLPQFKTDKGEPLAFSVKPQTDGIDFTIRNNTDQTATIVWDESYFIMPDGNSYKAVNIDVLTENRKIIQKANYTSVIPSHASFSRFTTSSRNDYFSDYFATSISIEANTSVSENSEDIINALLPISDYVKNNNNLGLGLMIEHAGAKKEYRFDVKVRNIQAFKIEQESENDEVRNVNVLDYSYDVPSDKWEKINKEI